MPQQATTLADQGQTADAPDSGEWQPLGVFSLVQGDETTSNNLFQLAVNKQDIIRGNYYDGLMDTTTPVYGSVDKKNQRAAWTIGKKNDRVFETGIYNLTKPEVACAGPFWRRPHAAVAVGAAAGSAADLFAGVLAESIPR